MCISYFGAPLKFLSDNGGEFSNDQYREMNEKLNIETCTTAGEAPFSNGIVERHNQILGEAFSKTLDDVKCEPKIALAWAVSAKNSLQNFGGFSPNQLVFGFNPNLPSVLHDKLPAMEVSSIDLLRQNMEAIHSSRKHFVMAESSDKIRKALRHNVVLTQMWFMRMVTGCITEGKTSKGGKVLLWSWARMANLCWCVMEELTIECILVS